MGKPTGFMEFGRRAIENRPPLERIRDWKEAHPPLDAATLTQQAARCMDCGVPFCHTGTLISGVASGCPINNLIPEWNDLVYRGQWREASLRLHRTNNFPEFTGRVCPAPCEGSCTVAINGDPVAIKTIEQEIADRAWENGWVVPNPPLTRSGRAVAVVGSGPAGLAAAAQLNQAGHLVTVFERADRIGGLLVYGIPSMKLDKGVVARRVQLMADEGVRFVTGVTVGSDVAAEQLLADFDAVVLATGATVARDIAVAGRELGGIHLAMNFLRGNTRRLLDSGPDAEVPIDAAGKDVVVIGGGDTGTDCLGTAIRMGARQRAPAGDPAPAARHARGRQPVAGVAEGLPPRLRAGGGEGPVGRGSASLLHHHAAIHRAQRAGHGNRGRPDRVDHLGGRALRDAGSAGDRGGRPRRPRPPRARLHRPGARPAQGVRV